RIISSTPDQATVASKNRVGRRRKEDAPGSRARARARAMEQYEVVEQIGRGAYGSAYLVVHKGERKRYVMKKIRLSKQNDKFQRTAYQEMSLMASLS
ncbi:hypothetical protein DKP78_17710, partial [Enterococcus faecium]